MAKNSYDYCIGTDKSTLKRQLTAMLSAAGFYSSGAGSNIPGFLRTLRTAQPWLAIIDTGLPPGNIEQLASIIENDGLAAAIYINTSGIDMDLYVQLDLPVEAPVLTAVAEAVCNEFAHKKKLQQEIEGLQKKLNERKDIEKAKGILVTHYKLSEEEAYIMLRNSSMKQRISMAEMSSRIISDPGSLSFSAPPR